MRKLTFIFILLISVSAFSQQDSLAAKIEKRSAVLGQTGNNELKFNLLYAVAEMVEISYENIIADNQGIGASISFSLAKKDEDAISYMFIPYYRLYFGDKKASGFFLEANTAIVGYRDFYNNSNNTSEYKTKSSFGIGVAGGGKFLTRNGLFGEAYLGLGRPFGNENLGVYPRVGLVIGKRF